MKQLLFLLLFIPACVIAQGVGTYVPNEVEKKGDTIPKMSLNLRPHYNLLFFQSNHSGFTSNNYEFVKLSGVDLKFNYRFLKVLTVGVGAGMHGFHLKMNNNSLWQIWNGDDVIDDVDYFGQKVTYLTVPMEFGIAPMLFRGGWFEPSFTIGTTPHFRTKSNLEVLFHNTSELDEAQETYIQNQFEGGAREVYTTLDFIVGLKVYLGPGKRTGIGISGAYQQNLTGPQTYLLKNGVGVLGGFTVSVRF
jgi:hypothetical protein